VYITFVTSLAKNLIKYPEVVLVNGGYDYKNGFQEKNSVDRIDK
jgi:hypothetical protein